MCESNIYELLQPINENKSNCGYKISCTYSGTCAKDKCDEECLKLLWEDNKKSRLIIQDCISRLSVNSALIDSISDELDY